MDKLWQEIHKVMQTIPHEKIIHLATNIQKRLMSGEHELKQQKSKNDWVTEADFKIQEIILSHFFQSALQGTYHVITEETLATTSKDSNAIKKDWTLVIDPLDGTNAFCKGSNEWGVMIGGCDLTGVLRASWCLLSTGELYTSFLRKKHSKLVAFDKKRQAGKTLLLDIYDYDGGLVDKVSQQVCEKFKILPQKLKVTCYPSAIWAGWELYQGKLDGLLWLPSNTGKKWYPDYDLTFLAAVASRGLNCILGKVDSFNALLAIGPTVYDAEKLYSIGFDATPTSIRGTLKKTQFPMQITQI